MISLVPDYHTRKASSELFKLRFPAYHEKLVKMNQNQYIITKKFNPIFQEKKVITDCYYSNESLKDTKVYLSDTTEVI